LLINPADDDELLFEKRYWSGGSRHAILDPTQRVELKLPTMGNDYSRGLGWGWGTK